MKPQTIATQYFAFENDFVDSLRCVPMVVRFKLDTCGIKLPLPQWVKLTLSEKEQLAARACATTEEVDAYRAFLVSLLEERFQSPATPLPTVQAAWENDQQVPSEVQQKAGEWHCPALSLAQWNQLGVLQRFALVKLESKWARREEFPPGLR